MSNVYLDSSSVTYPAIGRCGFSCRRCRCECEGCASLNEMIHLQWETTASPEGDVASAARDAASPNFGICDTCKRLTRCFYERIQLSMEKVVIFILVSLYSAVLFCSNQIAGSLNSRSILSSSET
jgi:hypothetical protein